MNLFCLTMCAVIYDITTYTSLPKLGQSSQLGLSTPARHASQNHGMVEQELTVLETLSFSDTP